MLDAGMVGTEMLYYLVGSRDLDGGLMCTASHNPKAYTGAKLVRRGAIALSGDAGIGDVRRLIAAGLGRPSPAAARVEQVDIYDEFQAAGAALHRRRGDQAAAGRRRRRQRDGRPDGRAAARARSGSTSIKAYWTPDGNFPDHEPNPLLPENREFIMAEVVRQGADLGIAWDGDADRCFFIDDTGAFVDGDFLTALLAESMLRQATPAPDDPLRRPRQPRGRRHGRRGRRERADQPRRPRVLQDAGCARRAASSAARSRATTTSGTSTARTRARSRRC